MTEFDEPLARKVLSQIEALQSDWRRYALGTVADAKPLETWDQGVWRRVVPSRNSVRGSCGTAMCFAGWAAELTGEWLLSPQEVVDLKVMSVPGGRALAELVLAGEDARNAFSLDHWLQEMWDETNTQWILSTDHEKITQKAEAIQKYLLSRYVCDMKLLPVSSWAASKLGLGKDPMGMFSSHHGLDDLRFIVDTYSLYGTDRDEIRPHLTPDERARYLDESYEEATID